MLKQERSSPSQLKRTGKSESFRKKRRLIFGYWLNALLLDDTRAICHDEIPMIHLLIDGYNLLYYLRQTRDLEKGRNELVDRLHRYQSQKRIQLSVVFDSSEPAGLYPQRQKQGSVEVIFSEGSRSADDWIVQACQAKPNGYVVVSDDVELRQRVQSYDCIVLSCQEFNDRIRESEAYNEDPWIGEKEVEQPLYPKINTKKKGQSRKAPNKERRKRQKLKKL